jgi:hypothetical protein
VVLREERYRIIILMECLTPAPLRALVEATVSASISWQATVLRAKPPGSACAGAIMSALGSDLAVALARCRLPIVVAEAAAGRVSPPGGPLARPTARSRQASQQSFLLHSAINRRMVGGTRERR